MKWFEKFGRKVSWNVNWKGKSRRTEGWIVKKYNKYGSWIVKWYGQHGAKQVE